jgi:hypothetical protein
LGIPIHQVAHHNQKDKIGQGRLDEPTKESQTPNHCPSKVNHNGKSKGDKGKSGEDSNGTQETHSEAFTERNGRLGTCTGYTASIGHDDSKQ